MFLANLEFCSPRAILNWSPSELRMGSRTPALQRNNVGHCGSSWKCTPDPPLLQMVPMFPCGDCIRNRDPQSPGLHGSSVGCIQQAPEEVN